MSARVTSARSRDSNDLGIAEEFEDTTQASRQGRRGGVAHTARCRSIDRQHCSRRLGEMRTRNLARASTSCVLSSATGNRSVCPRSFQHKGRVALRRNDLEETSMSRLARASAAALILAGSTFLLAQAQNPTGDPRPLTPGGVGNPSIKDQKSAPTNPPKAAPNTEGTGSRPIGPPGNETPGAGRHQGHQGRRQEEPAVVFSPPVPADAGRPRAPGIRRCADIAGRDRGGSPRPLRRALEAAQQRARDGRGLGRRAPHEPPDAAPVDAHRRPGPAWRRPPRRVRLLRVGRVHGLPPWASGPAEVAAARAERQPRAVAAQARARRKPRAAEAACAPAPARGLEAGPAPPCSAPPSTRLRRLAPEPACPRPCR